MTKSADAFRTISEVADLLNTPAHVLRFWESRFPQIKPVKRAGGRRYYRPADVALLGGIKALLHNDGLTIRGVQKLLKDLGPKHVASMAEGLDLTGEDDSDAEFGIGGESGSESSASDQGASSSASIPPVEADDLPPPASPVAQVTETGLGAQDETAPLQHVGAAARDAAGTDGSKPAPETGDHKPPQTTQDLIREAVNARLATQSPIDAPEADAESDAESDAGKTIPFESRSFETDPLESDAESEDGAFEADSDADLDDVFSARAQKNPGDAHPEAEEPAFETGLAAQSEPRALQTPDVRTDGTAVDAAAPSLPANTTPVLEQDTAPPHGPDLSLTDTTGIDALEDEDAAADPIIADSAAGDPTTGDTPFAEPDLVETPFPANTYSADGTSADSDPDEAPMIVDAEEEPMQAEIIAFTAPPAPRRAAPVSQLDLFADEAIVDRSATDVETGVEAASDGAHQAAKPRTARPRSPRAAELSSVAARTKTLRLLAPATLSNQDRARAAVALNRAKHLYQHLQAPSSEPHAPS